MQEENDRPVLSVLAVFGMLLSGFLFVAAAAALNRRGLGFYLWPLVVCVDLLAFSIAGFFLTEGKKELIYGICGILAADCVVVQLAVIF